VQVGIAAATGTDYPCTPQCVSMSLTLPLPRHIRTCQVPSSRRVCIGSSDPIRPPSAQRHVLRCAGGHDMDKGSRPRYRPPCYPHEVGPLLPGHTASSTKDTYRCHRTRLRAAPMHNCSTFTHDLATLCWGTRMSSFCTATPPWRGATLGDNCMPVSLYLVPTGVCAPAIDQAGSVSPFVDGP